MKRYLITICLALAVTGVAAAQKDDPLIGDRPDFTESSATVSSGRIQFETGFTHEKAGDASTTTVGEVLVRFGLGDNTEGRINLGSWAWIDDPPFEKHDGLTDVALGFKYRFVDNDGLVPETALLGSVSIPSGADGVSDEEVVPGLIGAFGWDLSDVFALGANLGWSPAYDTAAQDYYTSVWGSAALAAALGSRFGAFLEVYGYTQEEKDGDTTGYADTGLTYLATEDLQFDVRVGKGFNGIDDQWFWGAGVIFRL